jgi:hypothetical protein
MKSRAGIEKGPKTQTFHKKGAPRLQPAYRMKSLMRKYPENSRKK